MAGEYHEHNMTKAKTKSVPSDFPWPDSEDENRVETCLYLGFKLVSRWVKTPVKKYNGWMGYCRVFSPAGRPAWEGFGINPPGATYNGMGKVESLKEHMKKPKHKPAKRYRVGDRIVHRYIGTGTFVKYACDGERCYVDIDRAGDGENPQPVRLDLIEPYPPKEL